MIGKKKLWKVLAFEQNDSILEGGKKVICIKIGIFKKPPYVCTPSPSDHVCSQLARRLINFPPVLFISITPHEIHLQKKMFHDSVFQLEAPLCQAPP